MTGWQGAGRRGAGQLAADRDLARAVLVVLFKGLES